MADVSVNGWIAEGASGGFFFSQITNFRSNRIRFVSALPPTMI